MVRDPLDYWKHVDEAFYSTWRKKSALPFLLVDYSLTPRGVRVGGENT